MDLISISIGLELVFVLSPVRYSHMDQISLFIVISLAM